VIKLSLVLSDGRRGLLRSCGNLVFHQQVFGAEVHRRHTRKHRNHHLEGLVNLLANLGTGQDNLAADKDQKHNLGLHHAVDETGEELGFIGAEHVMLNSQAFKSNGELDVARADNVLNLEVGELGVETELLNDSSELARRKPRVIF